MGYRYHDYQCEACGYNDLVMLERDDNPEPQPCPRCEGMMLRIFGAPMVLNNSYRDGTKRFDHLREKQRLTKAKVEAETSGSWEEVKRIKREKDKLK